MQTHEDPVMTPELDTDPNVRGQEPTARTRGARRDFYDDPRRKSPTLALVLSAMPGVGQVYVGYYHQGFTNAFVVASVIALLNSNALRDGEPFFGMFLAFYWLYNMIDAWRRAVFYNNALAGIGPATLPEDFAVTSGRGSLAGGAAMIVVGLVLLGHTLFGMPLDWLEKWWPAVFIGVGAWLVYPTFAAYRKPSEPPAA